MPARVSYLQRNDDLHRRLIPEFTSPSVSPGNMACTVLAVQPPSQTQTGQHLYPPVIAKLASKGGSSGTQFFATAVLLDASGNVVASLEGTKAVTGVLLDSCNIAFAFTDLTITLPGTYTIRLDMYAMSPGDAAGASLISQVETSQITACQGDIAPQRPSSTERDILRQARDAGVPLPPSPR
ncbi:hypothetical protein K4F52_008720 [Lecanicillium sp. MT-2017a]|nr:hypothetical protein K4F52_008720 [Lecanicillium sp. MT-2017a]